MAKHVKGSAIANASSYKLYLANGTELATQSTNVSAGIDFDLSTIAALTAPGTYSLGVKAISGDTTKFLDSLMSNLVSYTVDSPATPTNYTFTINPTPTSATVTLSATGYSTVSGTGSKGITVANGTTVNWSVSASGYTEQTGSWTISGGNKTENIALTATGGSDEVSGWILAGQSGVAHDDLVLSSMLGTQYFVFDDSASYFTGKTIDKVWFAVQPSKEDKFNVEVFLVNLSNTLPTAWELKETIAVPANSGGQKLTNTLTTPITVPAGYTIGVRASLASISSVDKTSINNKSLACHYYNNISATSSTAIGLMSYDFHIQE